MRDLLAALMLDRWILPALLLWPLVGAALVAALGRAPAPVDGPSTEDAEDTRGRAPFATAGWRDPRNLATAVYIGEALLAALLWAWFQPGVSSWQAVVDASWIADWGARFTLGVDGLSLVLVAMTAFIMPLAVLGSWRNVGSRPVSYYALLLAMTTGVMGVFLALDLLLFYVCWELVLVPMYFMIGMSGGGERRSAASLQYFIVATLGSLFMLAAIAALWVAGDRRTLNLDALIAATRGRMTPTYQLVLFLGFFLAFAIKSAFFPLHSWLPGAQKAAPTSAAVALGIKVGTFGMLRFALPLFPAAVLHPVLRTTLVGLAVAGILYGALVATAQTDLRRIASYASVSHLGFVVLGIFALTPQSIEGAMLVMVSHGISLGALFILAGILDDRAGSDALDRFGGLARTLPLFSVAMVVVALSAIGLPGTNGFVGEFLVLLGAFKTHPGITVIATVGVILAAVYLLRALQRVLFETPKADGVAAIADLDARERFVLAAFTVAIVWLGVAPGATLRRMEGPVQRLVDAVQRGAAADAGDPLASR